MRHTSRGPATTVTTATAGARRLLTALLAGAVSLAGLSLAGPARAVADRDCGDFDAQAQAQRFFVEQGGPRSDPHVLDGDGDGTACESLPCPCSSGGGGTGGTGGAGGDRPRRQVAVVARVVDGDTVAVRLRPGGAARTVRMLGIDTPEVHGGTECGGPAASRFLARALPVGRRVVLRSDLGQGGADRYGRILRYVHRDGRDVNRAVVASGHSRVYVHAGDPFERVRGYRAAESSARAAGRGLWTICWR